MQKSVVRLVLFCFVLTGVAMAQVHSGDTEFALLGTVSHLSGDKEHFTYFSRTIIAVSLGLGKFISPNIQIGVQPTWNYWSYKYTDIEYNIWDFSGNYSINEQEKTESKGVFGMNIFTNFNITPESKLVPYLTAQLQITDFSPEDGDMMDTAAFGLGGGVRYFLVQRAAVNTVMTYNIPLKDAEYKYKTLAVIFGLSIML